MKAKRFLTCDTESTGLGKRSLCFDLGYVISDKHGILAERSFLVKEIITNPRVMLGALFNDEWRAMMGGKLFSFYLPELANGNQTIKPWREIVEILRDDMRTHSVDVFAAYNLPFDMTCIAQTQAYIYEGGKVLDYTPDLLCLWNFACTTVCNTPMYHRIAAEQNNGVDWISDKGNVRTNAEKVYAYLTGNYGFIESHTALHDAQIENEILHRLRAKKKPIPYNDIQYGVWRKAQILGIEQRRLL